MYLKNFVNKARENRQILNRMFVIVGVLNDEAVLDLRVGSGLKQRWQRQAEMLVPSVILNHVYNVWYARLSQTELQRILRLIHRGRLLTNIIYQKRGADEIPSAREIFHL